MLGVQAGVQSAGAVGLVGQLRGGRRLEGPGHGREDAVVAQVGVQPERGVERAHGSRSRVVGVVRSNEPVVGAEREVVEAKGAGHVEPGVQGEAQLSERGRRPDPLPLVERQVSRLAALVGEVPAVVVLHFAFGAEADAGLACGPGPRLGQRDARTAAVSGQVDHLRGNGVVQVPPDAVGRRLAFQSAHGPAPRGAGLQLAHVLARSPGHVEPPRLVAALVEEVRGQRPRVERVQLHAGQPERQRSPADVQGQPGVERLSGAPRVGVFAALRRVVPEAVQAGPAVADSVAGAAGGSRARDLGSEHAVRAAREHGLLTPPTRVGLGASEQEHAPGGVAVQGGRRSPQCFHAGQRADVQVVQRGLAVGERGRDAVHENLDAAHAELGPGPEAADGDALAHGQVVPVLDANARQGVEGLFDRRSRGALRDFGSREDRSREGEAVQSRRRPQDRDHDRGQGHRVRAGRVLKRPRGRGGRRRGQVGQRSQGAEGAREQQRRGGWARAGPSDALGRRTAVQGLPWTRRSRVK